MSPPGAATSVGIESDAVPIGTGTDIDHQSRNKAENDGINWRQPQISMKVEQSDVEFSFVAVQFAKQKERNE